MSLPVINVPKFTLKLPISGMEVKARPFLIREQKMLLQAMEIGDKDQVTLALDEIMKDCTFGEINVDELSVPDVEYLMLHIRSKSVGDSIKMNYTCKNELHEPQSDDLDHMETCNTTIAISININDIKIKEFDDHDDKILLDGGLGIQLQDIPYGVYKNLFDKERNVINIMKLRNSCIKSIFDENKVWTREEFNDSDLNTFIENLYSTDYEKIEKYIETMPVLEHTLDITCPDHKCGYKERITLKGLDDFLV